MFITQGALLDAHRWSHASINDACTYIGGLSLCGQQQGDVHLTTIASLNVARGPLSVIHALHFSSRYYYIPSFFLLWTHQNAMPNGSYKNWFIGSLNHAIVSRSQSTHACFVVVIICKERYTTNECKYHFYVEYWCSLSLLLFRPRIWLIIY